MWQPFEMTRAGESETELLVRGGDVVTMDANRTVIGNGAVVVRGTTIMAVGPWDELRAAHLDASVIGDADALVTPGYVNGHQHMTGDDVLIAGRQVVRDGSCRTVDLDGLREEATRRRDHLLASRC